jgi:Flp pilus assembly protein TadG
MKISRKRVSERRRGQALAEFALIMPVLFLVVAGIIEFGRGWNIKQAVTDAAREGARYVVVVDKDLTIAQIKDKIKERLALANIPTTDPPTTITITDAANFHCPGGALTAHGAEMSVVVTTTHRMGFVGAMMGAAGGSSTITISSKATMRNEC